MSESSDLGLLTRFEGVPSGRGRPGALGRALLAAFERRGCPVQAWDPLDSAIRVPGRRPWPVSTVLVALVPLRPHFDLPFLRALAQQGVRAENPLPVLFGGSNSLMDEAMRLIERVNMTHRLRHRPGALSRGEMQRVALARALVKGPDILFADEPTANLDRKNGEVIWNLFQDLHESDSLTIVVATHNIEHASSAARVVRLDDGRLVSDEA